MAAYFTLSCIAVPCALFLLFCLTPMGKRWLRKNDML